MAFYVRQHTCFATFYKFFILPGRIFISSIFEPGASIYDLFQFWILKGCIVSPKKLCFHGSMFINDISESFSQMVIRFVRVCLIEHKISLLDIFQEIFGDEISVAAIFDLFRF